VTAASSGDIKVIVAGLKKTAILAGLSDRQLKRLAKYAKVRDIPKDSVVVTRGEKGIGFYVVLDGQLQVRKGTKTIAHLKPGDFFGEMALFEERPRTADVVTTEPSTVVVLSRWEFWGFASDKPDVLRTITQEMARRLEENRRTDAL
jgi:CRP/FNR family cyclic AMP-dependent transcriptional regulator